MKERPILFSGEMVKAVLAGKKTQTRRIIKLPRSFEEVNEDDDFELDGNPDWPHAISKNSGCMAAIKCPYGKKSDRLWVRETFCIESNLGLNSEKVYPPPFNDGRPIARHKGFREHWQQPHYRATDPTPELEIGTGEPGVKWRPSIFMPHWASRITLKNEDIKIERLNDISEEDAKAEGVAFLPSGERGVYYYKNYLTDMYDKLTAKESFKTLWELINGKGSWNDNPYIWAVKFRKLEI